MRVSGTDLRGADDAFPDKTADGVADRAVGKPDGRSETLEVDHDLRGLLAEFREGVQQHLPCSAEVGLLQGRGGDGRGNGCCGFLRGHLGVRPCGLCYGRLV